jgi:hypothetical protein
MSGPRSMPGAAAIDLVAQLAPFGRRENAS